MLVAWFPEGKPNPERFTFQVNPFRVRLTSLACLPGKTSIALRKMMYYVQYISCSKYIKNKSKFTFLF